MLSTQALLQPRWLHGSNLLHSPAQNTPSTVCLPPGASGSASEVPTCNSSSILQHHLLCRLHNRPHVRQAVGQTSTWSAESMCRYLALRHCCRTACCPESACERVIISCLSSSDDQADLISHALMLTMQPHIAWQQHAACSCYTQSTALPLWMQCA